MISHSGAWGLWSFVQAEYPYNATDGREKQAREERDEEERQEIKTENEMKIKKVEEKTKEDYE